MRLQNRLTLTLITLCFASSCQASPPPSERARDAAAPRVEARRAPDAAQVDAAPPDQAGCVACHQKHHPRLVAAWASARCGGPRVACEACHGADHDLIFRQKGRVSPKVCGGCHPQQAAAIQAGGHADGMKSLEADPQYLALSPAEREATCEGCHGVGRVFEDGGRGDCAACHADHAFSKAAARRPEACVTCHTGAEHPESEAWAASRHGIAFKLGDPHAPGCVDCHVRAHTLIPMTLGGGLFGAALKGEIGAQFKRAGSRGRPLALAQEVLTREVFEARRADMVKICRGCHSARFAKRHLKAADALKQHTDAIIAEAAQMIWALHGKGLLDPMPADRPPVPLHGHALVMGATRGGVSRLEQRFYELARLHRAQAFKGAYHSAPHQAHEGLLRMDLVLGEMRQEARRLRAEAKGLEINE